MLGKEIEVAHSSSSVVQHWSQKLYKIELESWHIHLPFKVGLPFLGWCWWILEVDPLLEGCMLMNSRGRPPSGWWNLGIISMNQTVFYNNMSFCIVPIYLSVLEGCLPEATIFASHIERNFQNHFGQLWWATKSPRRRRVCQFSVAQNRWERNRLHWSNLLVYFDMAWNIRRFDVKHAILATSIGGITFSFFR